MEPRAGLVRSAEIGGATVPYIKIKLFATLQLKLDIHEIDYDGPEITAGSLIDWIQDYTRAKGHALDVSAKLLDVDDSIRPGTMLLIDGHNVIHAQGLDTPVTGEVFSVFPPAGGG